MCEYTFHAIVATSHLRTSHPQGLAGLAWTRMESHGLAGFAGIRRDSQGFARIRRFRRVSQALR